MFTINLGHLLGRGVRLDSREAVAIAQGVASACGAAVPENVELTSDGTVSCIRGTNAPGAAELAGFLQRLLPPETRVPAPLRYSIARALGQVEAPPFESLEAFSTTLRRFEAGPRAEIIRGLLQRVARPPRETPPPAPVAAAAASRAPTPPPGAAAHARSAAADVAIAHSQIAAQASRRTGRSVTVVVLALAASAIAGFLFMRAATLRQAHSLAQAAASVPSTPAPADEESAAPAPASSGDTAAPAAPPERPVASTGRADALQPVVRARAFSPAFSNDGRAILFQTGDPRDPTSAIAMASVAGSPGQPSSVTRIVDDGSRNYHARPSPDGRLLAFDSDRDGERGVYVSAPDGSRARRVSGPGYAALPTWSPDGSQLAYIRAEAGRPSVWNLWVQPLDGAARRITSFKYGQTWSASWFPDNRRICYTHEDTLTVVDLSNGRWRRFRSPIAGALMRTPAVSPDGSTIVFQVFRDGVWMLDPANGRMERLLADATAEEFAWSPDGTRIAFHSKRSGEWGIYLLPRG